MVRTAARVVVGIVLLGALLGCAGAPLTGRRPASPIPSHTAASPTPAKSPTALPVGTQPPPSTLAPGGRLPAVLAQLSLALPEGDAYEPQALAFDEAGRAVVLCYGGQSEAAVSALVVVDPAQGTRGPVWTLPGLGLGSPAAAAGRAYVGYQDQEYRPHLAAVDLDTGRLVADVLVDHPYFGDTLAADPAGPLYMLLADRLQVRDAATLQVTRALPYEAPPGERALALDAPRRRLYLAAGERLLAFRTSDLQLLWEATSQVGAIRSLTLDRAGERIYARTEAYEGGQPVARLLAFASASGQALEPLQPAKGTGWQLVAADSRGARLVLSEPGSMSTRLWQSDLDGRPTGVSTTMGGWAYAYGGHDGRLLALLPERHLVRIFAADDLRPLGQVPTGIEIRNLVADPSHERAYLNDSAGNLHVVDSRGNRLQASIPAGCGPLVLDAPNDLLFVGREPWADEVAVVDTGRLAVTAVITGGYKVAVDSAGRRAFVGWTAMGLPERPGEVQVWDTRTFRRLGAIAHRGEPTYNPLRDEIYLCDYSAYVVDGKSLAVTGELTPDISQQPLRWCNGCSIVERISVDVEQDLLVVAVQRLATGGGPGGILQPRLFAASTRQPVTHTATVLAPPGGGEPLIIPPEDGRVYAGERYLRYVAFNSAVAYVAGSAEVIDYRDGLKLDLYLPGTQVGLSLQKPFMLAFDARSWEPLGWLPYQPIRAVDPAGRRLYAWARSLLTVLSFAGGQPLPPAPAEPASIGNPATDSTWGIYLSPAFARDRAVFAVVSGRVLRSTDGGASWLRLGGGLPAGTAWNSGPLAISPDYEHDRTLLAGGPLGVWRSTDGGDSWAPSWQGLAHLQVQRVVISPRYAEDHTVLAYCQYNLFWQGDTGTSLFRSVDGGASWELVTARPNAGDLPPLRQPEELLPYPEEAVRFRSTDYGEAVQRSADGGETWQTVLRTGQPGLLAIVRSPAFERDGQVFALYPYVLYRSTDGGLTWQAAADPQATRPSPGGPDLTALAVGLGADGQPVVFLGDRGGSIAALDPRQIGWGPPLTPAATPAPATSPTPCAPDFPRLGPWQQDQLGCPSAGPADIQMAWQPFERGQMLWHADRSEIYVLYSDPEANRWLAFPDTWQEGQTDRDPALQPPAGLEQPIRGFGKVWREELGGPQAVVGWAVQGEQGYVGQWQEFSGGLVLSVPGGGLYALLADGTWVSQ